MRLSLSSAFNSLEIHRKNKKEIYGNGFLILSFFYLVRKKLFLFLLQCQRFIPLGVERRLDGFGLHLDAVLVRVGNESGFNERI